MSSAKQYPCFRYRKKTKSSNVLIRHLNAYIKKIPQTAHLYKFYNDEVDKSDMNLEDGSQLLDETNYTVKDITDLPTEKISWDWLLARKSLPSLREKWFTENKFPAGTLVSDIKYNYLRLKYHNNFYPFNDQLDYALAQNQRQLKLI